ncbi:MAG: MATE family efflux transporter [Pseudomonadales bacterium]|nr:MATE family efflux transporter [Pseudomonadales bacterium]
MDNAILQQPVKNALITMAAPAAFGMLMTFMFQLVDSYFVGQLGSEELAAISFAYPVYFFVISFFMGSSAAVAATVGKALGESDFLKAARLTSLAWFAFMLLTVGLGFIGYHNIGLVFSLLGASETMQLRIAEYMQPLYLGMFALVGTLIANGALMAKGLMLKTTVIMAIGGLVNLVLDYLFIFGWGVIPAMALEGAALATVAAWCVTLFLMTALLIKENLMSLSLLFSFKEVRSLFKEIMIIAIPAIAAQILSPLAIFFMTRLVAQSGEDAVAALGIATRIESLGLTGILALSVILTPFVAQNFGAKQHQRLDQVIAIAGRMTVYWGLAFYLLMLLLSRPIAGIFTDDIQIIEYSRDYFFWVGLSYPAFGLMLISGAFFNGVQQPGRSLKITLLRNIILMIPLVLLAAMWRLEGIWLAIAVANILAAIYAGKQINSWLITQGSALPGHKPIDDYIADARSLKAFFRQA